MRRGDNIAYQAVDTARLGLPLGFEARDLGAYLASWVGLGTYCASCPDKERRIPVCNHPHRRVGFSFPIYARPGGEMHSDERAEAA